MSRVSDLHKKWLKSATYRKAYAELEEEFAWRAGRLARARLVVASNSGTKTSRADPEVRPTAIVKK
jgi:hypothetical protein